VSNGREQRVPAISYCSKKNSRSEEQILDQGNKKRKDTAKERDHKIKLPKWIPAELYQTGKVKIRWYQGGGGKRKEEIGREGEDRGIMMINWTKSSPTHTSNRRHL